VLPRARSADLLLKVCGSSCFSRRVAQACRLLACLRPAHREGRIHPDKERRDVCTTRPDYLFSVDVWYDAK
jgi:hypothetical protein